MFAPARMMSAAGLRFFAKKLFENRYFHFHLFIEAEGVAEVFAGFAFGIVKGAAVGALCAAADALFCFYGHQRSSL